MKINYLGKYWRKYRLLFILGVLFVLLEAVCDLLQPRIMAMLVDDGAMQGSMPDVLRYGSMMLGVAVMGLLFALTRNYIASQVSQRFAAELRLDMFKKIQSLSSDGIDGFEEGSLITRETNDITQLQNFANGLMRVLVKAPFICIGAIIMAATLNLRTIPVIVPIIAAVVIIMTVCMKLAYPRFGKMQNALDRLNTTVREYLMGIRLVKSFRRFKNEEARFDKANDSLTDATIEANRVLAVFSPFMAFFVHLGIAAMLWLGARWIEYGDMQVGQIMAFVSYMTNIMQSLNIISHTLNMFVRVRTSHQRIAEVFNAEPGDAEESPAGHMRQYSDGHDPPDSRHDKHNASDRVSQIADSGHHIELCGISFRYKGSTGQPALQSISFALKKGETLGIIGPTGSGKSTLAALLMRFYEPTEGEIHVNGIPLSKQSQSEWRSRVAIVPQSPTLFTGSIRENIAWGNPDASDEQIDRAAEDAQAYGFISSSPDGYERKVGRSGTGLSGGQKQRVSIARALVRHPELLVLDDCTSALDVVTEAAVKDALSKHPMTTVLITQRVMTVRGCDKILVLENGAMAGFGTHEQLRDSCSVYRDIYRSQIGGDEDV